MTKFVISVLLGSVVCNLFPAFFTQPLARAFFTGMSKQDAWAFSALLHDYFFPRAVSLMLALFGLSFLVGSLVVYLIQEVWFSRRVQRRLFCFTPGRVACIRRHREQLAELLQAGVAREEVAREELALALDADFPDPLEILRRPLGNKQEGNKQEAVE